MMNLLPRNVALVLRDRQTGMLKNPKQRIAVVREWTENCSFCRTGQPVRLVCNTGTDNTGRPDDRHAVCFFCERASCVGCTSWNAPHPCDFCDRVLCNDCRSFVLEGGTVFDLDGESIEISDDRSGCFECVEHTEVEIHGIVFEELEQRIREREEDS